MNRSIEERLTADVQELKEMLAAAEGQRDRYYQMIVKGRQVLAEGNRA